MRTLGVCSTFRTAHAMPQSPLRKIRVDVAVPAVDGTEVPPGDYHVEQLADAVTVYADAEGGRTVATLAVVDFLDALAHRAIVFVSWG